MKNLETDLLTPVDDNKNKKSREDSLIEQSAIIALQPPDGNQMSFMHSILCQVGLPRSKQTEREFFRQSGSAWLSIQAGKLDEGQGPVDQPLPYGPLPRLALAYISTAAIRNRSPEVSIFDSAAKFLDAMSIESTGPRHHNLRRQMHALAACRLQIGLRGRTFSAQPISQFDAWLSDNGTQKPLWPGIVTLSSEYFNELMRSGVPLDGRALKILKGTALGLDIYTALAQRLHRIADKSLALTWHNLKDQFGQEYTGKWAMKSFRTEFLIALKLVQLAYPRADIKLIKNGVEFGYSPPPVEYKPEA